MERSKGYLMKPLNRKERKVRTEDDNVSNIYKEAAD